MHMRTHTYAHTHANMTTGPDQIIHHEEKAGVLRPAYVMIRDEKVRALVLCIRGTQKWQDLLTSLTGETSTAAVRYCRNLSKASIPRIWADAAVPTHVQQGIKNGEHQVYA